MLSCLNLCSINFSSSIFCWIFKTVSPSYHSHCSQSFSYHSSLFCINSEIKCKCNKWMWYMWQYVFLFCIPLNGLQHFLLRRGRGGEEAFLLNVTITQRSGGKSMQELTHWKVTNHHQLQQQNKNWQMLKMSFCHTAQYQNKDCHFVLYAVPMKML